MEMNSGHSRGNVIKGLILRLQEAMALENLEMLSDTELAGLHSDLTTLEQRLERIRDWGMPYAGLEFSPEMIEFAGVLRNQLGERERYQADTMVLSVPE